MQEPNTPPPSNPAAHGVQGRYGRSSSHYKAFEQDKPKDAGDTAAQLEKFLQGLLVRLMAMENWKGNIQAGNGLHWNGQKLWLDQRIAAASDLTATAKKVVVTGALNGQPAAGTALYVVVPRVIV